MKVRLELGKYLAFLPEPWWIMERLRCCSGRVQISQCFHVDRIFAAILILLQRYCGTVPFTLPLHEVGFISRRIYRHYRRDGVSPAPAGYTLRPIGTSCTTIAAATMHACPPPDFSACVARRRDRGSAVGHLKTGNATLNGPVPLGDINGAVRPSPTQKGRLRSRRQGFRAVVRAAAVGYPASSCSAGCWFRSSHNGGKKPEGAAATPEGGHPEAEGPEGPRTETRSEVVRVREWPEVERVPWPGRAGGYFSISFENSCVNWRREGGCSSEGSGRRRRVLEKERFRYAFHRSTEALRWKLSYSSPRCFPLSHVLPRKNFQSTPLAGT